MMAVNSEVYTSLIAVILLAIVFAGLLRLFTRSWSGPLLIGFNLAIIGCAYMLYFFRDPERLTPDDPALIFAGADGKVMGIKNVVEPKHLHTNAVRISIFLSLLDVHVNRAPIPGTVMFAQYFPGERYFTFQEKSSDFNQHSEIVIENERIRILVNQVVGPIARRVIFWCKPGTRLQAGERLGMMKFGSRLDIYIPADDIQDILVKTGQTVTAGETVLASLKPKIPEPETMAAGKQEP
jgi:phosphatidylserine decarboxylase